MRVWAGGGFTEVAAFNHEGVNLLDSVANQRAYRLDGVLTDYLFDVEVPGLEPETVYYYVCGGEGGWSGEQTFRAAPLGRALGVVNTALTFFLWNRVLRRLETFEVSVLQNTRLIQITVLAWVFLGERFTAAKVPAMALVFLGALIV